MVNKEYGARMISTKRGKVGNICLYVVYAYLVFTCIYLAGEKISVFNTAWDLTSQFTLRATGVLDLYRCEIMGGIVSLIIVLVLAGKNILKKDVLFLAVIFAIMGISAIVNKDLAGMDNLVETFKICNVVALFYLLRRAVSKEEWKSMLKMVTVISGFIFLIGCIYSLILYFINYHGYYWFNGFNRASRQGIMDGRLFGCFSDPNYAAFVALILATLMAWIFKEAENKAVKVYSMANIVVYFLYIVLSGSRSTYVTTLAVVFFMVIYVNYIKFVKEKLELSKMLKKMAISMVLSMGIMIVAYFAVHYAFQGIGYLIKPDRNIEEEFERNDVSEDNISNSRFRIWSDYLTLLKDKPVVGFSSKGALIYATQKDPDSYLADRKYNTHNAYVFILVSTGIVGFCAFAAFIIFLLIKLWKKRTDDDVVNDNLFYVSLVICAASFVYYFFNLGIMTSYRFETVMFWMATGYLAACICDVFGANKEVAEKKE